MSDFTFRGAFWNLQNDKDICNISSLRRGVKQVRREEVIAFQSGGSAETLCVTVFQLETLLKH